MILSRKFSGLFVVVFSLLFMASCSEKQEVNTTQEAKYFLLNRIPVVMDDEGYYSFAVPSSSIRGIVEDIFITKNQTFKHIDDFGFGKDDLGVQYFYATEKPEKGTRSIFILLRDKGVIKNAEEIAKSGPGGQVPSVECENFSCCDICAFHSTLRCICHDITDSCMTNPPLVIGCQEGGGSSITI